MYGVQQANVNKAIVGIQHHMTTYSSVPLASSAEFVLMSKVRMMEQEFLNESLGDVNITMNRRRSRIS